jgi:acetate kinase
VTDAGPESARSERAPAEVVLCLNAGSSSVKFALFRVTDGSEESLASGDVQRIGTPSAQATLKSAGHTRERACPNATADSALEAVFQLLEAEHLPAASIVGHRVVHGGRAHLSPARVDATLLASLKALVPLAPLHMPGAITGIEAALARLPSVPQVACFDTSFHAALPEHAARLPIPARFHDEGVRRFGFHGLSYEYVLSALPKPLPERIIVAHLGSGASLCAIRDGRSVDTTMGFTPGGGILMGTRSGDLDPGLLFYLLREKGYSADTLETLLERESGLLGVGGSSDLRILTEKRQRDEHAQLALTMLGYAIRKVIGAYFAVLGGLDLLVFTGGIGEHSPLIREGACRGLDALGISLDEPRNEANERSIHAATSCPILVVAADEDRMIARHARAVVRGGP